MRAGSQTAGGGAASLAPSAASPTAQPLDSKRLQKANAEHAAMQDELASCKRQLEEHDAKVQTAERVAADAAKTHARAL